MGLELMPMRLFHMPTAPIFHICNALSSKENEAKYLPQFENFMQLICEL